MITGVAQYGLSSPVPSRAVSASSDPPVAPDPLSVSESEWRVMTAVWDAADGGLPGLTAADVIDAVTPDTGWSHRTTRTLLGRLVGKGVLGRVPDPDAPGRRLYAAAVSRRRCVRAEGRGFLNRVFAGDAGELLVHFAQGAALTPDQAAELRELLDDAERRGRGR